MAAVKKNAQEKDSIFPNPPADGISSIAVNGSASTPTNMVIAGSWDNMLSMYEIQYNGGNISNIIRHQQLQHEGPVLCCDIGSDGLTTFSAGCDNNIRMWNASQPTSSAQIIGKHDQPVRAMKFLPQSNVLVTASWDKTVRLWDCRQPNAAATLQVKDRVYAMDAKDNLIVVGTADRQIHVFQMTTKQVEYQSPLSYQTRCISIFHDRQGFALGSIEGRCGLEYFNEIQTKMQLPPNAPRPTNLRSFAFKCHRDTKDIFAVNSIDFHPFNTFCSAGSDGVFSFWDKDSRARLHNFDAHYKRCPITAVKFSPMGSQLFYAISYDWSKGSEFNNATLGNTLAVHTIAPVEITPRKK